MAGSRAGVDAYVQEMLDKHSRLVEVTVSGHQDEWQANKHQNTKP